MKKFFSIVILTLLCGFIYAATPRAVVLSKITIDGRAVDSKPLLSTVEHEMKQKGFRIVDIATSLMAQYTTLEKKIKQGKVPKALSKYNADVIAIFTLSCTQTSAGVMGSNLKTIQCHLNSSVIRMENGTLIAAESTQIRGAGLSKEQAVQMIIKKKVSKHISTNAPSWKKKLQGEGSWNMDVTVTGIPDKAVIDSLEKKVLKIKDITAVSIVTYRGTVAKLTIEGSGPAAIKNLIAAFPKFKTVPLQITYQSGMETHLQYDIGRHLNTESAFFLRLSSIKTDKSSLAMLKESGPALCSAALSNLDFIHGSSVSMTTKSNKELLKSLNSQKTPLLVVTTIGKNGNTWQNSVEILHVKSKKKIVTTTATGKNPLEALTRSVAKLDTAFRKVLTKKWAQKLLSVDKNSAKMVNTPHIEIPTFSIEPIYPVLLPLYRKNGVGTLTLKNSGKESLKNIEIQFSIDKRVISTEKIAELKPGKTSSVTIKPNLLPPNHSARWYGQLKAAILYAVGDTHAAKDGYAPLLIHEKNAMNWETPDMLAAFIDSSNSSVRDGATRGVKNAKSPLLLTSQLERASALYETLWHTPLRYVKDPVNTSFSSAIDTVQYPWETMNRKAGDCDDLTVLLASLYESIGLSTIVITTPGHVLLGVESGVLAGGNLLFALPETLFIEKDGALFIPVEATAIVKNFGVAWQKGASILQSAKSVNVFRTREAWKKFVPFSPSSKPATMSYNTPTSRKEMLNMLRKSDKSSVPAWYKSIYDALVHKKPVQPKIALKKASPIALANVMLFTGKFEEGVISLANQCGKGSAASCYNLAVATLFTQSAAKSSSAKTIKDGALIDAVSMLPLSVRQMLLDGGGMGMGDEATTTSDTQKKLAEALKRAAQRIAKAKKSPGFAGKIKTSSVGGRKGAKAPKSINDIAPLLFWKEVSNGSKR